VTELDPGDASHLADYCRMNADRVAKGLPLATFRDSGTKTYWQYLAYAAYWASIAAAQSDPRGK
jgi:hypothetical protein